VSEFPLRPLYSRGKNPRYALNKRLVEAQGEEKNPYSCWNVIPIAQPVSTATVSTVFVAVAVNLHSLKIVIK
jgi:hypothetical protein